MTCDVSHPMIPALMGSDITASEVHEREKVKN